MDSEAVLRIESVIAARRARVAEAEVSAVAADLAGVAPGRAAVVVRRVGADHHRAAAEAAGAAEGSHAAAAVAATHAAVVVAAAVAAEADAVKSGGEL